MHYISSRFLLSFIALIFIFSSCSNNNTKTGNNTSNESASIQPGTVSADAFEQKIKATAGAQIIDVRTPEEYSGGHLQDAVNIDWNGNSFDQQAASLDKSKPVFVYCLAGSRSHQAASHLKEMGFNEIYELEGGVRSWNKAGKALVTGEKAPDKKGMSVEEYNSKINSDKLVLVDFNAPWCGPCKRMAPMLDEISKEQKANLELVKINSDENETITNAMKVENLPTLFLYKKGKEVWSHVGYMDKIELMVAIQNALK